MEESKFVIGFKIQKEWGAVLACSLALCGLGGALIAVSQFLNLIFGILLGIILLTGGVLFLGIDLGRPTRFWRAINKPLSSWISRGSLFIFLALISSLLYIAPSFELFTWLPWTNETTLGSVIQIISILTALLVVVYTGFLMAASPSIPFWNSAVLPLTFLACSLTGGISVLFVGYPFFGLTGVNIAFLESTQIILYITSIVIIVSYLMTMYSGSIASKESVRLLTIGKFSPYFIGGVILIGLIVPLLIGLYGYFVEMSLSYLLLGGILDISGVFLLRYIIIKAGIYPPIT